MYLQVQDEDTDGDGIVNWADGFNGIGAEIDVDDVSADATFAPLWVRIPEMAYDPLATLEVSFRLTGRIGNQLTPVTSSDAVRVTTARIEVLADNRDGTAPFPTFGLTATRMPNPNAGLSGLVPDITQAYTINVYDPRGPKTVHTTYVAGTPMPLLQSGTARYTTPLFLAVPKEDIPLIDPDEPVDGLLDGPLRPSDVIGQAIVVPVSGTVVHIRYNGETTLGLIKKDAAEKAIALLRQVVTQVDARLGDFDPVNENGKYEGGDPRTPGQYQRTDAGAMGKEAETRIHRRFEEIAKDTSKPKATRELASQFRKGIVVDANGIV